ncbi:tRNA lysidine(34) synthetase TilS [Panacibacter sp. DH6]|uniref:tRNA(Ile)-lysidine synthase n=1 Tax=Panacibacter microcysteis TaxID=2793269 RepID=A0A931DZT5_9BACT|nr:tRNA lysidine(34) synthetase TilS [Panacibacter microcysteis]MBG9374820.1 tRNA lysidine(34) synthetase TilS [Panacibacter microcysteis]
MLLPRFLHFLKEQFHLQPAQTTLLLAVSGGIDSVVLTDLCAKAGFDFLIAHVNFQLRGAESDRDETFVRSLQTKYNKKVFVQKFDTAAYAAEYKLSIQEAARNLRYEWFASLLKKELPAGSKLATAHNANDNIETLLMHFFRGTGLHGLTGMPVNDTSRHIIRPLLFAKRNDVVVYAQDNNLTWVEDSSNSTDKYTRNYFRLQLLPAIKEVFSNVEDNLLANIQRFSEAEDLYMQAVKLHKAKLPEQKGNEWHVPILKWQKAQPLQTITWEIIRDFGFGSAQVNEVLKLFTASNGSFITSDTHRIIRNRQWLIIAPVQNEIAANIVIGQLTGPIHFEHGVLLFGQVTKPQSVTQTTALAVNVDAALLKLPLLLRKWKQGDYFYPLGMQKKKKLGKFFIDNKLSKTEKEKVWVIESDKRIVWVIGYRIDDRFKITTHTKTAVSIAFEPRT